jgi:hypothetical protein
LLRSGVLPVRAFLYTVVHQRAGLVSLRLLDGVLALLWFAMPETSDQEPSSTSPRAQEITA